ncbi:399_t:CDS:1, partial [Scutellospora calospora]
QNYVYDKNTRDNDQLLIKSDFFDFHISYNPSADQKNNKDIQLAKLQEEIAAITEKWKNIEEEDIYNL